MTRKPVQIASSQWGTTVLCDDGTIWWNAFTSTGIHRWEQFPEIPQPSTPKCNPLSEEMLRALATRRQISTDDGTQW